MRKLNELRKNALSFCYFIIKNKRTENPETKCNTRTEFQRDRDRIIYSKAFRRLKHKPRFISPEGDHYKTRLTHTLEVSQIARTIARSLRLNEDLTEAIALGHDLGTLHLDMQVSVFLRKFVLWVSDIMSKVLELQNLEKIVKD